LYGNDVKQGKLQKNKNRCHTLIKLKTVLNIIKKGICMEMMLSRETPKKPKQMPHINQIKNCSQHNKKRDLYGNDVKQGNSKKTKTDATH
jgi:hypothetical protein